MGRCHHCGREFASDRKPGRTETCEGCGKDLRVCLNCGFYAEGYENQCREPRADRVVEKDRGNFCDWFRFRTREPGTGSSSGESARKNARDAFNSLFGGE